jgi:hypothetical protein
MEKVPKEKIVIRERSHCTIFTIDSRNQESVQIPGLADSWFLESMVKMVQWDLSLIKAQIPGFRNQW